MAAAGTPATTSWNARLCALRLHFLQLAWFAAVIGSVLVLLAGMAPAYKALTTVCLVDPCSSFQLTPSGLAALQSIGLSVEIYVAINLACVLLVSLVSLGLSVAIYISRPRDPMALFTAITLVLAGNFLTEYVDLVPTTQPVMAITVTGGNFLAVSTLISLFFLFPDGHFVPRWGVWALGGWVASLVAGQLEMLTVLDQYVPGAETAMQVILWATCFVAPVLRYRRADARARQQLKWALFGLLQLAAVIVLLVQIGPAIFPELEQAGTLPDLISEIVQALSLALLPCTIAFAILRYRLWDVDLLLNRTLVYVPLMTILGILYGTTMSVTEKLFVTPDGEQSQAVAVFTTIVLTSTFTPINNMLESMVERYFKESPDPVKPLRKLENDVAEITKVLHHGNVVRNLVEHAVAATKATGGALFLQHDGIETLAYATENFDAEAAAATPSTTLALRDGEHDLGRLLLGPHAAGGAVNPNLSRGIQQSATGSSTIYTRSAHCRG